MRSIRTGVAVLAATVTGLTVAGSASAALLPAQLGDALKKVDIPGIATAYSSQGVGAHAAALEGLPIAAINRSESGPLEEAEVTRLAALNIDLTKKETDGSNSGPLAALGDLIDSLNKPCSVDNGDACLMILDARAGEGPGYGRSTSTVLGMVSPDRTEYLAVLPNAAETETYFECQRAHNAILLLDNKVTGPIEIGRKDVANGPFC